MRALLGETSFADYVLEIIMTEDRDAALEHFLKLVAEMRKAQIAYFKTHGGLSDCKKLERAVDRELAILLGGAIRQGWLYE